MGIINNDNWKEWSMHVLKELERLDKGLEKVKEKNEVINSLKEKIEILEKNDDKLHSENKEQDDLIKDIELKYAKWMGIAVTVLTVITIALNVISAFWG